MKQEGERRRDKGKLWQQRSIGSSSVASFFFFSFFTLSAKSPVPEGDLEGRDLPYFSVFASVFSSTLPPFSHHVVATFAFLGHHLKSKNTYFGTLMAYKEAVRAQHLPPE